MANISFEQSEPDATEMSVQGLLDSVQNASMETQKTKMNVAPLTQLPLIVFLVPTFDYPLPRNLRIKNLLPHLKDTYRITIITLSSESRSVETETQDSVTIVRVPYSWLSRNICNRRFSDKQLQGFTLTMARACSYLLKRLYFIPDPWVVEKKRLVAALNSLQEKPDTLVALMKPFSMADVLYNYRERANGDNTCPVVLDIGDPLADNAAGADYWNRLLLRRYELKTLKASDHIVVTNRATATHYSKTFGIAANNLSVIPQGATIPDWAYQTNHSAENSRIDLRYAGGFTAGIRDPMQLFTHLKSRSEAIKLSVCGGIDQCFIAGNDHVDFIGWLDNNKINSFYKDADCLLYFENNRGMETSGKIFELLATRKPILFCYGNDASTVKQNCEQFGHIIFVKNNSASINKCLSNLDDSIKVARQWLASDKGQKYSIEQFTWRELAIRFSEVLDTVAK